MPKPTKPDPEIEEIFDQAQQKGDRGDKAGQACSKDVEADKKARRAKASLDDAFLRAVERNPKAPDMVADAIWGKAINGDMDAIKYLNERIDGKTVTPFALAGLEAYTDEQLAAYRETLLRAKG